jgi:hypothetical protein
MWDQNTGYGYVTRWRFLLECAQVPPDENG